MYNIGITLICLGTAFSLNMQTDVQKTLVYMQYKIDRVGFVEVYWLFLGTDLTKNTCSSRNYLNI
jgi:hypothetical protein